VSKKKDIERQSKTKNCLLTFYMFVFFFIFYALLFYYFKKTDFLRGLGKYDYLIFGFIAAATVIFLPLIFLIVRKIIDKELNR